MPLSCMRLSAIAITVIVAVALREDTRWRSTVLSLGFGHYLLSLWYARRKFAAVASGWNTALPMMAAIAGGAALYFGRFPLVVYFAVHHVFNEVYVNSDILRNLTDRKQMIYRASAIPLQTLLYFYILRSENPIRFLNQDALLAGLILSYVCYVGVLLWLRTSLAARDLIELSILEIVGLAAVVVSVFVPIRFLDVVCYHFVFWWFYPAVKLAAKSRVAVFSYAALTALLVAISFLLSPAGLIGDYPFRDSLYLQQFFLWSHIHITSSFFLSAAHPAWIRRWFTQRELAARTMRPDLARKLPSS
jgi:hypothetical protein